MKATINERIEISRDWVRVQLFRLLRESGYRASPHQLAENEAFRKFASGLLDEEEIEAISERAYEAAAEDYEVALERNAEDL